MSELEVDRFVIALKSDAALRAEAEKGLAGMSPEAALAGCAAFAVSKGYNITADEMRTFVQARAGTRGNSLSDAELNTVAGGNDSSDPLPFKWPWPGSPIQIVTVVDELDGSPQNER